MARFNGTQGKGALRRLREIKREEAQERNAQPTPHLRTKRHRKGLRDDGTCADCPS